MLKKRIKEYLEINKLDILKIICLLILGVIIGIIIYFFINTEVKNMILTEAKEVFEISKTETYVNTNIILNGVKTNIILIAVLAILSITLFGKLAIYAIMILKGVAICIYTILIFNIFGPLWGTSMFILMVLLVNIIYLPALILLTITFLEVNFNIFEARLRNINTMGIYKVLLTIIICFLLMISSVVIEQIASTIALSIYIKL